MNLKVKELCNQGKPQNHSKIQEKKPFILKLAMSAQLLKFISKTGTCQANLKIKKIICTQQIDEVKLGNTFFLSDDLDEELQQQQQTVQQRDSQSKSSSKSSSRAVIYSPLATALNNIKQEQTQLKQIIHVSNEKTIYQERILQCYQLIWKFYQNLDQPLIEIDVHFFSRYLYYWFIGDYDNTLNIHYTFQKWISQESQGQSTVLNQTRMKLNYQTIFNNGNANIKLLLFDYIFLNHYTIVDFIIQYFIILTEQYLETIV